MKHMISFLFLALSFNIFAADSSSGCGPGWYIFKETSLVSSALRATTNGILFPTTTIGMTVGTSNCTKHKVVINEKKSLHFTTHNFFELKEEATLGKGQFISAFTETLGCRASGTEQIGKGLKDHFKQVFEPGHQNPDKVLLEVYKVIFSNPELSKLCSDLV